VVDEKKGLKSVYSTDGVHPTKEGYVVMEKVIRDTILTAE
jgi:lysophospholipase L1-like esterase